VELKPGKELKQCLWQVMCKTHTVKVIIHGYMHDIDEQWVHDMVKELLKEVHFG